MTMRIEKKNRPTWGYRAISFERDLCPHLCFHLHCCVKDNVSYLITGHTIVSAAFSITLYDFQSQNTLFLSLMKISDVEWLIANYIVTLMEKIRM